MDALIPHLLFSPVVCTDQFRQAPPWDARQMAQCKGQKGGGKEHIDDMQHAALDPTDLS